MFGRVVRYGAAACVLAVLAAPAWAESSQYQRPGAPVDPNARLPAVIQFEQFLNRHGITGLNNIRGSAPAHQQRAPATARPPQPATAEEGKEGAVKEEAPVATFSAPTPRQPVAPPPREEAANAPPVIPVAARAGRASLPPMIAVAAPATDADADSALVPLPSLDTLYAPPVRPPWWERLLSSREFLWAMGFCLLVVPAVGFAASSLIGRRREERDLALYD